MTNSKRWLALGLVLLDVGFLWTALTYAPQPIAAAPLAQATATPTLPPVRVFSEHWGVQSLPQAGVNCIVDLDRLESPISCVPGTPVP